MNINLILSIILGKIISYFTKLLKIGGGSAAPGLYTLRVYPNFIAELSSQIPQTIIITGTNGKTTTARMLGHLIESQGLKVLRNVTGSNLERGIASALLQNLSFNLEGCRINYDLAIWELDEATFNTLAPKLKPDIIVFLNVFRDQLDRYGEIDSVVAKWCKTISKLKKATKIILNGDDASLLELEKCFTGTLQTFGVSNYKIFGEKKFVNSQKKLDFEAKDIEQIGLEGTKFNIENVSGKWEILLAIPGIYHIYDFLAAFAVSQQLKLSPGAIINSFKNFSPAFGRVEKFNIKDKEGYIFLIKNPVGATQVFQTIQPELKENDSVLFALNDNFADGTDVSWIWDANFEILRNSSRAQSHVRQAQCDPERQPNGSRGYNIYISGTRAADLALRLKYAGFNPDQLIVQDNLNLAFKDACSSLQGRLFILPTYTCLLELQKILARGGFKKEYWKENQ